MRDRTVGPLQPLRVLPLVRTLTKNTLQNQRRPLVAQAFRPATRPPASSKGLRCECFATRRKVARAVGTHLFQSLEHGALLLQPLRAVLSESLHAREDRLLIEMRFSNHVRL